MEGTRNNEAMAVMANGQWWNSRKEQDRASNRRADKDETGKGGARERGKPIPSLLGPFGRLRFVIVKGAPPRDKSKARVALLEFWDGF